MNVQISVSIKLSSDYIRKPVIQATWCGIHGGMGTVNTDTLLSQPQQWVLLWIAKGEGLYATEDYGIYRKVNNQQFIKLHYAHDKWLW